MLNLPEDLAGQFGVVLIYRGSWCPFCSKQLARFQEASDALVELGVRVAALSVDDEETSRRLIEKLELGFPVGHSADVAKVAEATGAYVDDELTYLQATEFVLAPDSTVAEASYSSGAGGRLTPFDVAGLIRYIRKYSCA